MQTLKNRSLKELVVWTREDILGLLVAAAIPTVCYEVLGWRWLSLPWLPIALIGTAVSFIVSFKNNASYERAWEARKIWGAVFNSSRAFVVSALSYLKEPAAQRRIVKLHLAWLTALRYQLREPRPWETIREKYNAEYLKPLTVEEHQNDLPQVLNRHLCASEVEQVLRYANPAAHILALQSTELRTLSMQGELSDYKHVDLQGHINALFEHQGGSERIKNFPYPRQYATLNVMYIKLFTFVLPFGMLHEFDKTDHVWLTIPLAVLAGWIFTTMEKMGEASENPFEGGGNDVPITQISRAIEIDLLQFLGEEDVPSPIKPENDFLF